MTWVNQDRLLANTVRYVGACVTLLVVTFTKHPKGVSWEKKMFISAYTLKGSVWVR